MKKYRFRVGDLVREKNFEATETSGYGIVTMSIKIGTSTKYRCIWSDDKEYLIYCFNKGWIKHPEIKKFIQQNIDFMEEVKHKHWLSCNSDKLNFIAKWWKKILEKKYNSPTIFGIKSVRLIKTKASLVRPRRNVLSQIRYRKGRCVSLKAYRKEMRENLEAAKKFAERKKREEGKVREGCANEQSTVHHLSSSERGGVGRRKAFGFSRGKTGEVPFP